MSKIYLIAGTVIGVILFLLAVRLITAQMYPDRQRTLDNPADKNPNATRPLVVPSGGSSTEDNIKP